MRHTKIQASWLLAPLLMVAGMMAACTSPTTSVTGIRLGMTKSQLRDELGRPGTVKASGKNENGRDETIWGYTLNPDAKTGQDVATSVLTSGVDFFDDPTVDHRYEFQFIDGRLVKWGRDKSK